MKCASFLLLLAVMLAPSPAFGQAAVDTVGDASTTLARDITPAQEKWLKAKPFERVQLAERIGERGARRFARSRGWQPISDGALSTLRQGLDQVYRDADGAIHVVEAKGGSSQLGRAYGHVQGTPEWAVKAAQRTLRSSKASATEKEAARAVLKAARNGKLQVHVVRTNHVLGEPTGTVLERTSQVTDDAARLAETAIDDLAKQGINVVDDAGRAGDDIVRAVDSLADDAVRSADDIARAGATLADDAARTGDDVARAAVNLVDDAGRVASMPGKVASWVKGPLRVGSKVAVPVAVGVDASLRLRDAIETEHKFAAGQITEKQREIEHARNVAGMAGGWGGAIAGAKLGALAGGGLGSCVAPGPGTAVGGGIGAVAGGVAGYLGGETAAEAAAEWTVRKVHATGTTVASCAGKAWRGTKSAARWTADKASAAWAWAFGE